jgi:hypothetical protein
MSLLAVGSWKLSPGRHFLQGATFARDDRVATSIISPAEFKMWHGFSLWHLSSLFADGTDGNA